MNCLNCGEEIYSKGNGKYCSDKCKENFYLNTSSMPPFFYPKHYSEGFRWLHVFNNSSLEAIEEIQNLTGYKPKICS